MSLRGIIIAVTACMASACVRVDGGAVEISWVVRTADGRAITDCGCSEPPIAKVRLKLVGVGGDIAGTVPCEGQAQCEFPCQRDTGSTPFDIRETQPGEMYEISVTAVGADQMDIPTVTAPAPILRSVSRGQATEVEAFLLVTQCSEACSGMNRTDVCARP